jgi:RNA polymerase sigma factor (sigma-70 family)
MPIVRNLPAATVSFEPKGFTRVEVSALKHAGVAGVHGRSPLLKLQSDERLVGLIRRGNHHAFEALMSRYQSRLLAFCRHMLGSREDAEDVLQEVFAAAFNAIQADDRPLNVRPWLYRIARNRSLNHLRRTQAIGQDSLDVYVSENGQTTADRVHKREEFRLLLADVQQLPETQRSALLLREIDALSYDQIAEAMDTTVPSVKSLLVRARVSLAEAAEARQLSCDEVRLELGEVAEGLKKLTPPARRHLRGCERCTAFRRQLRATNKALAAVLPIGPLVVIKKLLIAHIGLGGSATAGGGGAGAGAGAGAAASTAAGTAAAGSAAGSILAGGAGAVATKAAAGIAAAALVSVGAVEVRRVAVDHARPTREAIAPAYTEASGGTPAPKPDAVAVRRRARPVALKAKAAKAPTATTAAAPPPTTTTTSTATQPPPPSRTETHSDTTVLPPTTTTAPTPAPSSTTTTTPSDNTGPGGESPPPDDQGAGQTDTGTTASPPPPPPPQPTPQPGSH